MPPQRGRNGFSDSRTESVNIKEKYAGPNPPSNTKARRNGSSMLSGSGLKDVTNAQSKAGQHATTDATATINWASFDFSVLDAYRHAHRLDVPSHFTNSYNQRMLSRPGIGLLSPTMAQRRERQRIGKDQLALAVRKDFNAATVVESEIIPSFLYAVHNSERNFRMRFEPPPPK